LKAAGIQTQLNERLDAQILKMTTAVHNAIKLGRSAKRVGKLSEFELTASQMAFALVSDQKGQPGVNVGHLANMQANHVVMMVIKSLKGKTIRKHIETATQAGGSIVLASSSQVNLQEFADHLAPLGYSQHPMQPRLFVNTYINESNRNNINHAATVVQYDNEREDLANRISLGEKLDDQSLAVQHLLWRLNYWYQGKPLLKADGGRGFETNKADRAMLKEAGYELTWQGDLVMTARLKYVGVPDPKKLRSKRKTFSKQQKAEQADPKSKGRNVEKEKDFDFQDVLDKEAETQTTAEREAEQAQALEDGQKYLAGVLLRQRAEAEAAFATVVDYSSRATRETFTTFLHSFGLSDEEQRLRRKLESSVVNNMRVRKQVIATLERNQFGLTTQDIARLNTEPEFFVGYAFQLWADGQLKLNLAPELWFR
jgi:hypothetical protein